MRRNGSRPGSAVSFDPAVDSQVGGDRRRRLALAVTCLLSLVVSVLAIPLPAANAETTTTTENALAEESPTTTTAPPTTTAPSPTTTTPPTTTAAVAEETSAPETETPPSTTTTTVAAPAAQPTLVTDKEDYAPGEVVSISGSGYVPGDGYAMPVKRPDGSIVTIDPATHAINGTWDIATADSSGNLLYRYQLNGIEGLYEARAYPAPWSGEWGQTPLASVTFTDAVRITARTHQGQEKPQGTYTSGNVTTYAEGDTIQFRFTLQATDAGTGQLQVRFTGNDGTCLFFDGSFVLGTIQTVSGATPTVTTVGSPTPSGFGTSNGEWVQTLDITFSGAGEAVVNYTLKLSPEAGECNGSSQHSRLQPSGGDIAQTGQQNVPVPANQVIERPEITVIKQIDRNGDGSFESTATAGEFCFTLDAGNCVPTDGTGKVVFSNVTPDGAHTITETQLVKNPDTYGFVSGTGTNCTFTGSTATATVASGTTSTDATCIFQNRRVVPTPSISVTKTASPTSLPEPGGTFSFTVVVTNNGPDAVSIASLSDDVYGTLAGDADCQVGTSLAGTGGSCTFSFSGNFSGNAGDSQTDVVTVTASNAGGTAAAFDDAIVSITDTLPTITVDKVADPTTRPEPGGLFTFTATVTNTSPENVTILSLSDNPGGALDGDADCQVGTVLDPGESCSFDFSTTYTDAGVYPDVVTAVAEDDEGNDASDTGEATVTVTDTLPTVAVTKTANPTAVVEPGGNVTYTVDVRNSSVEPVTLTSLTDDIYGNLDKDDVGNHSWLTSTCDTGGTIVVNGTYTCTFTANVSGSAGTSHTNVVTGIVADDEGNPASDDDDATVAILAATGQIAPTATSCQDFRDGAAGDLTELFYGVQTTRSGAQRVGNVAPGVLFYYTEVVAPSANFTITINQTDDSNSFPPFAVHQGQAILYDSTCTKSSLGKVQLSAGQVTIEVKGATAGQVFIVGVKYDPATVVGTPVTQPYPSVNYSFSTSVNGTPVITSPDGLVLRPKQP